MTSDLLASQSAYLDILNQAVDAIQGNGSDRPSAQAVVAALVAAEKAAKQHRTTYPLEALAGRWQLCFTAARQAHQTAGQIQGRGWYVPKFVPAFIAFEPIAATANNSLNTGEISNQIQLGPVFIKLQGPFKYPGKKNLLAFDFTQAQFSLFGQSLYRGTFRGGQAKAAQFDDCAIAKLPFFAFFLVSDRFIAARGRGGGLAIWVRATQPTQPASGNQS